MAYKQKRKTKNVKHDISGYKLKILLRLAIALIISASLVLMYFLCGNVSIFNPELSTSEDEFKAGAATEISVPVDTGMKFRMYMIDVGQGDAILLEASGKHYALVDCGTNDSEQALLSFLRSKKIKKLEYVFMTHPHEDHIGGADAVIRTVSTETVAMPNIKSSSSTFERMLDAVEKNGCKVTVTKKGDTFSLGKANITVLYPDENELDASNDSSLVLKVCYGTTVFMLMGDGETKCENVLMSEYSPSILDCDVLKVAHHGSDTSSGTDFIGMLSPQVALISCGKNNSEGHPNIGTVETLENSGAAIYRTDELGTVTVSTDGINIKISYSKDERNR